MIPDGYDHIWDCCCGHGLLGMTLLARHAAEHIHFVEKNDPQWSNYLKFRDYLNAHPKVAKAYNDLKMELAEKFPKNRRAYTNGKHDFIRSNLAKK